MSFEDDESWRTYAMDAQDALRDIEGSLLSLETDPARPDEVNRLYRALHTLKGNSALLGLTTIETLAHAAEDMVGLARDGGVSVDQAMVDLMLELVDRLQTVVERAGRDRLDADVSEVADLVERVHAWTRAHGGVKKVEVGATRGEILIWSELPTESAEGAEAEPGTSASASLVGDEATLLAHEGASEFFLALCRELLPRVASALKPGAHGEGEGAELAVLVGQLSQPALRMGYFDLVDCLGTLDQLHQQGGHELPEFAAQRDELARLLTDIERRERELAPTLPDFGIAALCASIAQPEAPRASPPEPARAPTVLGTGRPAKAALERVAETAPRGARAIAAAASSPGRAPTAGDKRASAPTAERSPQATKQAGGNAAQAQAGGDDASSEFLRIDARKLSLIMDLAGEIALASGAVTHHPELEGMELEGFAAAAHKLEMLIRELQNEVSAMRLVPVAGVFHRMKRVVRDTARRTGKNVELTLIGEDTEIDKVMVDSLHDPLVHIVRNAIDHGIESPEERIASGKSPVGTVVLEASHQGGEVSVKVRDDGRGLNRERIVTRAKERGLVREDAQLSDAQIAELVFLPGFSTKEKIDELSGRGVGMDVIKTTIENLRGRVQLETKEGRGSSLNMTVPLTLAFVEAMVVRERDRLFALPIEKVFEVFKTEHGQLSRNSADGETTIRVRNSLIPVLWLHRFYGEDDRQDERVDGKVVVVVQNSRGSVALPVDALLGNQPVMLKPLRGVLAGVRAAAGCGMLRSGDVALALDCERLHA